MALSYSQALSMRDALARALYSQLFTWLVHRVNKAINPTLHQHESIALLDIFGFEVFTSVDLSLFVVTKAGVFT